MSKSSTRYDTMIPFFKYTRFAFHRHSILVLRLFILRVSMVFVERLRSGYKSPRSHPGFLSCMNLFTLLGSLTASFPLKIGGSTSNYPFSGAFAVKLLGMCIYY